MDRRALFIALGMSLLGVLMLMLYLKRFEREASGGDKVKLLVAVKPMERGKPIAEDQLSTREVPQAYLEPRAVREAERQKVIGLRLGTTVQAGQTLMWTDLATANEERRDLSTLILPGHRGVSIRTRREDSSAGMVKPGDYVDVIVTLGEKDRDQEMRSALVVLQKVLVLASNYDTSPEAADLVAKDRKLQESVLTISLTLSEAQTVAVAAEKGALSVALRSPDDNTLLNNPPRVSSSIFNPDVKTTIQVAPSRPEVVGGYR